MARHWSDFLHSYVLPLLKSLELQTFEVSLVLYYTRSPYSLCRLERSDWSGNLPETYSLLRSAHISGGGSSESCLPEALAEALYLFRCPSSLAQTDRIAKHCLLLSLTEAHNMAISWPYPILPASANQGKQTASFSVGMAEAFRQHNISMSIFTTYPSGQPNPPWPSILCKLFELVDQGQMPKAKTEEEQQEQHQQRIKLREQCIVGLKSGHFVLLSRHLGETVKLLQGQRSKRKPAQAFEDAPLNGYHKGHTAMLSAAMPRPASAMPTAESIAAGQQNSPFHSPAACSERPTAPSVQPASQASSPAPRPAPTQASASQDSSAVDLTSPDVKPPNVRPITVDLTEEESPQMPHAQPSSLSPTTARPQLQLGVATTGQRPNTAAPVHAQQHPQLQAASARAGTHLLHSDAHHQLGTQSHQQAFLHQQHASSSHIQQQLPQLRQQSPSPSAATTNFAMTQQQQLRQLQRQQLQQQHQQQQQQPVSAPAEVTSALGQQQQQLPGLQFDLSQQQQQQQHGQAAHNQAGPRVQQPVIAHQNSRPASAPAQGVIHPITQAQHQIRRQQQQQQQQQQLQEHQQQALNGGRTQPLQKHTLQQIQDMQVQLRKRQAQGHFGVEQGQVQGQSSAGQAQSQGQFGAGQAPSQGYHSAGSFQPRSGAGQGQSQAALTHLRQVQPPNALSQGQEQSPMALPLYRPGQVTTSVAQGQVRPGQTAVALPQGRQSTMMSPSASSTASARSPSAQTGVTPKFIWQGSIVAAAAVVKKTQDTLIMECKLGVNPATWPANLELGWGHSLVLSKLVVLADMTQLLGQGALHQAPRVGLGLGHVTEMGKSFIKDMVAKKAMAIIQLPHTDKFLGLVIGPASSSSPQPTPKLVGLVLTLPQQGQRQR